MDYLNSTLEGKKALGEEKFHAAHGVSMLVRWNRSENNQRRGSISVGVGILPPLMELDKDQSYVKEIRNTIGAYEIICGLH